ncbi:MULTISPECIES: Spy/CpxP family protein refolding chaperone [Marinomonas]|jgi:hypothetical protein|uniref:LTXXQ motif family protein n=1 Tax=Marinomonas fungiae TaxID=1137284 RepID=A0A0K6IUI0_9GAMM|nr:MULTISPECIES: Spy/CpxP family protein refolding chaperone [Marinomonas]CUB06724.1 LTXXQ motif family protein [Marinomonas fungiae]
MKTKRWMLSAGMAMSLAAVSAVADQQWSGGMMSMMGGPGMMDGCGMMSGSSPQGKPAAGMKHGSGMMHNQGMMQNQGMMHGRGMAPEAMSERLGQSLQQLESELKLSADQQSEWQRFVTVVKSQSESMAQHHNRMYGLFEQSASMTLPERVALHKEMMGERFASMSQFNNAITAFYQSLNAEQKTLMDGYPMMGGM